MKILVVEDSSSMRAYLTTIIEGGTESYDLGIVAASSRFEAPKSLPHTKFDALPPDTNMPPLHRPAAQPMGVTGNLLVVAQRGSPAARGSYAPTHRLRGTAHPVVCRLRLRLAEAENPAVREDTTFEASQGSRGHGRHRRGAGNIHRRLGS